MGDKTQLLSLVLAAKYRKPWPIVLGIFVATIVNHALAGAVGAWITTMLGPDVLRWILGVSFIPVSYTHLDVYKSQASFLAYFIRPAPAFRSASAVSGHREARSRRAIIRNALARQPLPGSPTYTPGDEA